MELKINLKEIESLKTLNENLIKKVTDRSIKRTAMKFKTTTTKAVRNTYNIKAKELKEQIQFKKTKPFEYKILLKGKTLGLEKFKPRQTKSGVSVMVKKGNRIKLTHAFLAKDSNGNVRVFERETKKRMPISRLFSLSVPQMFNDKILKQGMKEANETFNKEFKHNLDYYLGKLK